MVEILINGCWMNERMKGWAKYVHMFPGKVSKSLTSYILILLSGFQVYLSLAAAFDSLLFSADDLAFNFG